MPVAPPEEPPRFRELLGHLSTAFEVLQAKQHELLIRNSHLADENHHLRVALSAPSCQKDIARENPPNSSFFELDCNGLLEESGRQKSAQESKQVHATFANVLDVVVAGDDRQLQPHDHWIAKRSSLGSEDALNEPCDSCSAPTGSSRPMVGRRHGRRKTFGAIGQFEEKVFSAMDSVKPMTLKDVVTGVPFDITFAALILSNTCLMAFEAQYKGYDEGALLRQQYDGDYKGNVLPEVSGAEQLPNAKDWLNALEVVFGATFTFELVVKVIALRWEFAKHIGNWFDAFIVLVWLVDQIVKAAMPLNPMLLRLMRLLRLVRIARMVKTIQAFDSLQVLIGSIIASVSVLFWSGILLLVVQMMVALFLHSLLGDYIADDGNPCQARFEVYAFFGTFTRSMMTMFELTLGNWAPVSRCLVDNVSEWYGTFILVYKLVIGFAVVKVITGVFLHETFKVAATDDDLMIVQKHRDRSKHLNKMERLFKEADKDGDGVVSREEFQALLANQKMSTWLSAMEVEPTMELFDLCDDGDGALTVNEIAEGISRLKGPARNIDVIAIKRQIFDSEDEMETHLLELRQSIQEIRTLIDSSRKSGTLMTKPYPSTSYDAVHSSWTLMQNSTTWPIGEEKPVSIMNANECENASDKSHVVFSERQSL